MSLNILLASISRGDPPARSYIYATVMFIGLVFGSLFEAQYWQRSMRAGFRLRAALVAAIYQCVLPFADRGYHNLAKRRSA